MPSFTNQIAVVTGASSGIGKAIMLSHVKEGARICLVGRNLEKLEAVSRRSSDHFVKAFMEI